MSAQKKKKIYIYIYIYIVILAFCDIPRQKELTIIITKLIT